MTAQPSPSAASGPSAASSPSSSSAARAPLASTSLDLLDRSRASLLQACRTADAGERYVEAHLGALRAAAALLAARSAPGLTSVGPSGSRSSGSSGSSGSSESSGVSGGSGAGRPAGARTVRASTRSRPRSVWELLPRVAPELTEWSAFFAASARRRAAVERGVRIVARESDDLLREAENFLEIIQDLLGLPRDTAVAPISRYVAPVSRAGAGTPAARSTTGRPGTGAGVRFGMRAGSDDDAESGRGA